MQFNVVLRTEGLKEKRGYSSITLTLVMPLIPRNCCCSLLGRQQDSTVSR